MIDDSQIRGLEKLLNSDIIREMKLLGIDSRALIYADSAEPKTIEEIRRSGFNIQPTVKGADSITFGIIYN
jgi:phage terminase large subunit